MTEQDPVLDDPIGVHLIRECIGVAGAIRSQLGLVLVPKEVEVGLRSAYQVGLEIGLAIGVTDVAAARRMRDWLANVVQEDDDGSLRARERQVAGYLRVLDR